MHSDKKKILVFIDWFLPGYKAGGPIRSCTGLVERMSSYYHFRVVTGNTDLNDKVPYESVKSDEWNILANGAEVFYCSRKNQTRQFMASIITAEQPDLVYLNSMFSVRFTMLPLLVLRKMKVRVPVIIAPRGMLSAGALALKPMKKKLFLTFAAVTGMFKNSVFHASSEIEIEEVKKIFGNGVSVFKAINLSPGVKKVNTSREKISGMVKLVYLGRISAVKNLIQCLKVLSATSANNTIVFDVYGPHDDENYLQQCKDEISKLPAHIKVNLMGSVESHRIGEVLDSYHFFFMLTMNENYGHAIVESMSMGCPVIISDRTPWRNLESRKCGWDISLSREDRIVEVLNDAASMTSEEYLEWSTAASSFAGSIHNNQEAVNDHIRLFEHAMNPSKVI